MEMPPGYQAALQRAAFLHRKDRRFLEVAGKAPGDMLNGILSGTIPGPMRKSGADGPEGDAYRSAVLTSRGRMVTDLRIMPHPSGGFLLEVPEQGLPGLREHLRRYLPPRLATARDTDRTLEMLSLVGPEGAGVMRKVLEKEPVDRVSGESASEGVALLAHDIFGPVLVLENRDLDLPVLDLVVEAAALGPVKDALEEAGASPMTPQAWEILRIEAGTPLFGVDMTEKTIPVEAGIHERVIDHRKGCYTGQEVIIRIRDRGHVNKSLRRILLGGAPVPEPGTELFAPEEDRSRGWATSACRSPRFGQTVALGYVKRGTEPGQEVRLGSPGGPPGRIAALRQPPEGSPRV